MANHREAAPDPTGLPLSDAKRWLFALCVAAVPLAFFAVAEIAVRALFEAPILDDPYINLGAVRPFFEETEVDGAPHYQPRTVDLYRGRQAPFPAQKPAGGIRVFCLGESASAGWPHPAEETYGAYLAEALRRAYPDREVEVLNASAHAFASYRVRAIFEQVLEFDPDLLLIYTGNNEFLERRDYSTPGDATKHSLSLVRRSAVFQLLQYLYGRWRHPESSLSGSQRQDHVFSNWSKVERVALKLRTDPEQYQLVKDHYRYTITAMLEKAHELGVPVVLMTVPVNLRDWLPNVSVNLAAGAALERWRDAYRAGRRALLEGDAEAAQRSLRLAAAIDADHAETHFHLARAYQALGDADAARASYIRAKDLDRNPFRADSAFNEALRELAAQHPQVYLVDLERAFAAENPLPGFDLLLDYVHPTVRGNLVIARHVYETITARGVAGTGPADGAQSAPWPPPFRHDANGYDEMRDETVQSTMLWVFGMMHQHESMVARARALRGTGLKIDSIEPILHTFPEHLELERQDLLGLPVDAARERKDAARVRAYYAKNYTF